MFIGEQIDVEFDEAPLHSKRPHCPDRIIWRGETLAVTALVREWVDYGRRGRMADNMQPAHAALASQRGSWGVGRFYFRVQVADGRVFELYYDRAPKNVDNRGGAWFLKQQVSG